MIVDLITVVPDKLICPAGKRRIEFVDTGRTGLYVEVKAGRPGYGVYYHRYRSRAGSGCASTTRHIKLGTTEDTELPLAREKSRKLRAEITVLGKDPRAEEKAKQDAITFHDFFQDHYLPHAKAHKRTWQKDSELYDLRLKKAFGNHRLDQIKRHEVQSFHAALPDDGLSPASADHYIKLLRRCLNLAVEWDMLEKNPATGIKMFNPDNKVEHYLEAEELERLLNVLRNGTKRNFMIRMVALFLLSTGARLNEALSAKWKDIDRDNRVWRIPASTSKSKKVRSVPLNDSAIEVLDRLDTEDKFEWLFRSVTGERLKYVHGVWERLRDNAGLSHLRLHDLRHQHASFLVNQGHSLYVVQQILGHKDPSVTQRYAHLSTKSLQDASDSASKMIKGAMKKSA
jgi:integrase